jgi:hypothetical protein
VWVHPDASPASLALAHGLARALNPSGGATVRQAELAVLSPVRIGQEIPACMVELGDLGDPAQERTLRRAERLDGLAARMVEALRVSLRPDAFRRMPAFATGPASVEDIKQHLSRGTWLAEYHGADESTFAPVNKLVFEN